jgi:predicted nucleotidyltransferase
MSNFENQIVLCKFFGGSHCYGLSVPTSDIDVRGVFLNTELKYVLGLEKYEHQEFVGNGDDIKYKEFRHFLNMLKKSNTEAMETMFNDKWEEVSPEFLELQKDRYKLIDSEKAFKCLCGYMQGERKLMNGERTGLLGSKRKEALVKFGYSYKNAVQLLRLSYCGKVLFEEGVFPVNIMVHNKSFGEELLEIKMNPDKHTLVEMNKRVDEAEEAMKKAFDNRKFNYTFDDELANEWVYKMYMPVLEKLKK